MSLWDLAKDRLNENARKMQVAEENQVSAEDEAATREDSYVILFGSKNCVSYCKLLSWQKNVCTVTFFPMHILGKNVVDTSLLRQVELLLRVYLYVLF